MRSEPRTHHPELTAGRWRSLSLMEQLANTGSEVERALKWAAQGNAEYSASPVDRALELFDLTVADPKNRGRLKELTRLRKRWLTTSSARTSMGRRRRRGFGTSTPSAWAPPSAGRLHRFDPYGRLRLGQISQCLAQFGVHGHLQQSAAGRLADVHHLDNVTEPGVLGRERVQVVRGVQ